MDYLQNTSSLKHHLSMQAVELESLLLGLKQHLLQLASDVLLLEREDDGNLYGVMLENELLELINRQKNME